MEIHKAGFLGLYDECADGYVMVGNSNEFFTSEELFWMPVDAMGWRTPVFCYAQGRIKKK